MFDQALPEILADVAARHADLTAINFQKRATTYKDLDTASGRVAAWLAARGIRQGDRVGLYCINSDFFVQAYFGILKAGAAVVPVNLLLNPREIAFILNDAGARGLIYFSGFAAAVDILRPLAPGLEFRLRIGDQEHRTDDHDWQAAVTCTAPPPAINFQPTEDLAAILYTSGTTGRPKGAMLTHRNLAANVHSAARALQIEPDRERVLVVLPMFHAFAATAGMLLPLLHGCRIIPLPRFDLEELPAAMAREQATLFMAVPSMYVALLHLPDHLTKAFASLRYCISGGAALPVAVMEQFEAKFGKLIYEGDGPTECSPVTCVNPIGGLRKPGTVGRPVPDVEMRIMDEQGAVLPQDTIGEICVRGPNVMRGYWNLPEDTKNAFFGEWFRTGDLGQVDADGYFSIVDRKKDMIIINGMNIYPRIIEEQLMRHPVREARNHCRESLGRHEIPRKVIFLPDLPKNAAGKIMKRELQRQGEIERGVDLTPAGRKTNI
ncbi:MAG: long-chain fatty acid--CoA ligase [Lentisphaerae bacterium]|nr:long-chain fatty acid--CoA ligase [Lentisphaerota bacterium]